MTEMVNHPAHYTGHPSGVEAIEITRWMNFCLGNATKYVFRRNMKNGAVEDLRKAAKYVEFEIQRLDDGGELCPPLDEDLTHAQELLDRVIAAETGMMPVRIMTTLSQIVAGGESRAALMHIAYCLRVEIARIEQETTRS